MDMKKNMLTWNTVTLLIFLVVGVSKAQASGFAVMEQSVRGLGSAFAGAAAEAEDPSTIFFNPAGLTRLAGHHAEVGLHVIIPQAKFKNNGSTTALGTSLDTHHDSGGDGGQAAIVPNLYYSHSVSDRLKIGLGIHAPYGLSTEYNKNWVGRYHAVESGLTTIDINPTIAYRIDEQWSVGLGLNAQKADAVFSSKADFGLAGFLQSVPGAAPQQNDGFSEISGDDWAYGYNFGVLFEPGKSTRFGMAFRSAISHELEGEVEWAYEDAIAAAVAAGGDYVDGDAKADVELPETLSLGFYHGLNEKWALLADITWTRWSRLEELRIEYTSSSQPDTVVTLDWNDTWRYGVGVIYAATDRCTGRFGLAYDQSPVSSDEKRTPRVPDDNRFWVTLGGGYRFSERAELNLAYLHVFIDDPEVDKTATGEDQVRGALKGTWDASVDVFSVDFNLMF